VTGPGGQHGERTVRNHVLVFPWIVVLLCIETIEIGYMDAPEGRKVRRNPMPVIEA
jgi:hypothetical protein